MPHDPYKALYIHIPFCASRCNYCDFTTSAVEPASPLVTEAIEQDILDIRRLGREGELAGIETIYIGGGTPTHVGSKHLTNLIYTLGLTIRLEDVGEFTVEANPESIDERLVADLWALGVNRLSIGVQSFDDGLLETLGRPHDGRKAVEAIVTAATRFDNISCDLICGIPGQTLEDFGRDLDTVLGLPVKHVSIYPLTIEYGTPFASMMDKGLLELPSEDAQADMMELAERKLSDAGFARYEVASYALPGYESAHNSMYWTGSPYIGIGQSATTMTQNGSCRMRVQDGRVVDELDASQMAAEDLMLGMRMSRGVSESQVERASEVLDGVHEVLATLQEQGLVEHADGRYRPTERGWIMGNELYGALLELADF